MTYPRKKPDTLPPLDAPTKQEFDELKERVRRLEQMLNRREDA